MPSPEADDFDIISEASIDSENRQAESKRNQSTLSGAVGQASLDFIFDIFFAQMWAHKSIIETARASATISYLLNTFSTYGTERRLFGRTNPEVSQRHDTLITPKGWAFSIWAIIFVGESLGLLLIWTNALYSTHYNEILVPFTYACILQSLWCVFFSKEKMLLSAIALTGIALCLKLCSDEISTIAMAAPFTSEIPYISNILISYPIRIHFAWTTAAALINWNMFIVSLRIPGLEVFPALLSVWIATGIALFRAFFLADSIFPAVLAWAFSAMSGKIRSSPPENFARDASFLEVLEITFNLLAWYMSVTCVTGCILDYLFSVSGFQEPSYHIWVNQELRPISIQSFWIILFCMWNIALVQNFACRRGRFQWQ